MEKIKESKNEAEKSNGNEPSDKKKIPIIETLKPKKRYTKQEKEMMEAFRAAMEVLIRQKNAKV